MKPVIFIDGREGTTGLQIFDRLAERDDISLLLIDEAKRKDPDARRECLNSADLVFLCLPDAAAREAVSMISNANTRVIDASTAHRTAANWIYGFPEILQFKAQIPSASRVANPGCHATGFLSTVAPLVELGILPRDYPLTCYSITGYSGGGKGMIAEYEASDRSPLLDAPNIYALTLQHKHLPEMQRIAGLLNPPAFSPILGDIYQGMAVSVLLHNQHLSGAPSAEDIWAKLADYYQSSSMVSLLPFRNETARLSAGAYSGHDRLHISVSGHREQTLLTALFDNLGKGASGAAVQNMNLMLGFEECTGLKP